jgi:hypothetical protein
MKITQKQKEDLIIRYRTHILDFVEECVLRPYNKETGSNYFVTRQQKEALLAVAKLVDDKCRGKAQDILGVSVMSGKGTGKDAVTAWIIQWFMFCFPFPKIPCVSVSADQLNKVLWSEITKWLKHSAVRDYFVQQSDKLFYKDVEENVRGREWFAFTKAANPKSSPDEQVETLAGQHADYMLQIVDEGSGVLNPVYETLEKNMTGYCNLMLIIFNPMHAKGYALDTQYKDKKNWITLHWSSEDSEIVNQENNRRIEAKYGRDSNPYRMNVLGLPPLFDENTLINWEWIQAAVDRELFVPPELPLVFGVDCGGGGDMSIIASRRGNQVYDFMRKKSNDSVELVNWIGHEIDTRSPDCVRVDTIGLGWHVEGDLRNKKGAIVEAADVRRSADNKERFVNKRAEMYWNLRECFEKGTISIPDDDDLKSQLSVIKYKPDKSGKTVIMEKHDIKKELGRSPDEADALAILYYRADTMVSRKFTAERLMRNFKGSWMRG